MFKDKIPYYSNEAFLDVIRKHNFKVVGTGRGRLKFSAVYIDLNATGKTLEGEVVGITCNFRCPGCFKNVHYFQPSDRLSLDEIKTIIDFAKKRGAKAVVYAGLGEPMMDQDFWSTIDYAYKNKVWTVLFTNGTFITEKNAKILYRKKAIVIAKLNTLDKEKQDAMVGGIKGASGKMLRGINYLTKAGFKAPRLAIESTISKDNVEDLKDVLRFCRKNNIIPFFESFVTKTLRKEDHESRVLKQKKLDQLFLVLQKIDKEEVGITTKLMKGQRIYGQLPCIRYSTMFSVRINGDVSLCVSDREDEVIGNMKKQFLEKILSPQNKKILKRYMLGCNCSLTASEKVER